jgi:cyclopropane fatty-acyl-phospholipid synthase-like methyltransferase
MRTVDRWLQQWRMAKALAHVRRGWRVLDIGTYDGSLFTYRIGREVTGVGVDPALTVLPADHGRYRLVRGDFPQALPTGDPFDAVTALAVLEHVPIAQMPGLLTAIRAALKPGGVFIATVPSPIVDQILPVLKAVRLIDGQMTEQHYGLGLSTVKAEIVAAGFAALDHSQFQFGMNNLLVCRRPQHDSRRSS